MPMARRLELASILAKPLMQRFGFREDTSSDLLLCALYYREFVIKQIGAPGESNVKHTQPPVPIPTASTTLGQATQAPPVLSVVAEEMSTSPTDRGANR
jgi:hypothetical protein